MQIMNMKTLFLVATFALSLVIAYPMMSLAQQEPETGNQSSSEGKGKQGGEGKQETSHRLNHLSRRLR